MAANKLRGIRYDQRLQNKSGFEVNLKDLIKSQNQHFPRGLVSYLLFECELECG